MLVAFLAATLSYAFYLEPHMKLEKWAGNGNNPLSPMSSSADKIFLRDTLNEDYHYLWTNFPSVFLSANDTLNEVIIFESRAGWEGYTFGKVEVYIERDTLFIHHNLALMMQAPAEDTTRVLQSVMVSPGRLKGIEVVGKGWVANVPNGVKVIDSPLKENFSTLKNRFPIQPQLKPLTTESDTLELNFRDGGSVDLYVQQDWLKVNAYGGDSQSGRSNLWLWGNCEKFSLNHHKSYFNLQAYRLKADTVQVHSVDPLNRLQNAIFRITAEQELDAFIQGWANVLYLGDPLVHKTEQSGGRVVNANKNY